MKDILFDYVIKEFAEIIDESLLPQTTISSLGLKLAIKMHPFFKELFVHETDISNTQVFANTLKEFLFSEFGYEATLITVREERIRFSITKCPFQAHASQSLCAIMQGIAGGLTLMSFGYSKLVTLSGPQRAPNPCCIDIYTAPTTNAEKKIGVEFSQKTVSLLRGTDNETAIAQRQARRRLALGLFSSMAVSTRRSPSERFLAQRYIEALSCIPEIKVATLYLKENYTGRFILASHYGLPEDVVSAIRVIGTEDNIAGSYDDSLVQAVEEFDAHKNIIKKRLSIRSFTSVKLEVQTKTIGVLNVGWKTNFPLSLEMRNAIGDSCTLLATIIDNDRLHIELERTHLNLEKAYIDSITLINNLVGAVDLYSNNHGTRVAELSCAIANEMGLPQDEINLLNQAALIHDIGKVNIAPKLLNKSDNLTEEEFELVKTHPIISASLVAPIPFFENAVPAILYHHERLDGSGYPEGLVGDNIPLGARIIAVADVYDAMTNQRAYRGALDEEAAIDELVNNSGIMYDTEVVTALIAVLKKQELSRAGLLTAKKTG